jgi:hypothetical protein
MSESSGALLLANVGLPFCVPAWSLAITAPCTASTICSKKGVHISHINSFDITGSAPAAEPFPFAPDLGGAVNGRPLDDAAA